jgi:lipid A disaccharide synthetase
MICMNKYGGSSRRRSFFVDYPGFNLRLAAYLRRKGFTGKLIYYISPQVWAWNGPHTPHGKVP